MQAVWNAADPGIPKLIRLRIFGLPERRAHFPDEGQVDLSFGKVQTLAHFRRIQQQQGCRREKGNA